MAWTNEMPNWAEGGSVASLRPYSACSTSPVISGGGGFEDVVNFELQQWIGPVTWVRNAAFLFGATTIGAGVLFILDFVMAATGSLNLPLQFPLPHSPRGLSCLKRPPLRRVVPTPSLQ